MKFKKLKKFKCNFKVSKRDILRSRWFYWRILQTCKDDSNMKFIPFLAENWLGGKNSNSYYELGIILILKPGKESPTKKTTDQYYSDLIFLASKITADGDCSHEIKRCLLPGRKAMINLDTILKSRNITLPTTVHLVQAMVFPLVMYRCELDHKESWASKNWCFWTVVLEKTLESPLDCKEIKQVHPKGN